MADLNLQHSTQGAIDYMSYLVHLLRDKPILVGIGAVVSTVGGRMLGVLPDHIISILALVIMVAIDWFTKRDACFRQGVPFTSGLMRKKGVLKLRDYILLYMAGAMTIPLMGDMWGYRSVLYFICVCELWSIAENLNDAGRLPFDIRHLAFFDTVRDMLSGRSSTTSHVDVPGASQTALAMTVPASLPNLGTLPGQIVPIVPPATTAPVNPPTNPAGNQGG